MVVVPERDAARERTRPARLATRELRCRTCCEVGLWHKASDHSLIGDGRFRGEADIRGRVTWRLESVHAAAVNSPVNGL